MGTIDSLLVLQECDKKLQDMEKQLKDIPARKNSELERLEKHKASLNEATEALKHRQSGLKDVELEADAKKESITKLRKQQLDIKTNKEFKAIESEIAGIEKDLQAIEERELTVMEEIEQASAEVKSAEEDLKKEESEVGEDIKALDARAAEIEAKLNEVKAERERAAQDVDPEWLATYERLLSRKGLVLVPLRDGTCGGCNMQVPPYVIHDAGKHTSIVTCVHCGRMLYS